MSQQSAQACRGDLAVIELEASATYLKGGRASRSFFSLALVTGVSRDGQIKKYRLAGSTYELGNTPARALLVSQSNLKTAQAFEDLATRCKAQWDANEFETVDAVRDYLRPYKRESGLSPAKESVRPPLTA